MGVHGQTQAPISAVHRPPSPGADRRPTYAVGRAMRWRLFGARRFGRGQALFSPGVADSSAFEQACHARGMQVFMADASVAGPGSGLAGADGAQFTPQFVGAAGRPERLGWMQWVASAQLPEEAGLMAQIDIEGTEYELLFNATTEVLNRFRILVIEFQDVEL